MVVYLSLRYITLPTLNKKDWGHVLVCLDSGWTVQGVQNNQLHKYFIYIIS